MGAEACSGFCRLVAGVGLKGENLAGREEGASQAQGSPGLRKD